MTTSNHTEKPALKTILKYPIPPTPGDFVSLPAGARILSVQMQAGRPQMWALVDPDAIESPTLRAIAVFGTGSPIEGDPGQYLATFQDGPFVWHVFDRTPREPKKKDAAQ